MFPFAFKEGGVRVSRKRDSLAKQLIISWLFIAKNQQNSLHIFNHLFIQVWVCFLLHTCTHTWGYGRVPSLSYSLKYIQIGRLCTSIHWTNFSSRCITRSLNLWSASVCVLSFIWQGLASCLYISAWMNTGLQLQPCSSIMSARTHRSSNV